MRLAFTAMMMIVPIALARLSGAGGMMVGRRVSLHLFRKG